MFQNYQGTLEDLNEVDVFKLNNAFILNSREDVKICCRTIKETLKNLGKVDVLEPKQWIHFE
jgi:hypothetical protein